MPKISIKIKVRSILFTISIFLLFTYAIFTSLATVFVPNVNKRLLFFVIGVVILFYLQYNKRKYHLPLEGQILLICMAGVVLVGYMRGADIVYEHYIRYICLLLVMALFARTYDWVNNFVQIMLVTSLVYIGTTIWLYFDTNSLFRFFANNLYPEESRFGYWVSMGYTPGITEHYSTNGMVLANAVIIISAVAFSLDKGKKRKLFFALIGISYVALFMTGKRAHLLFTSVAILIAIYIYNRYEKYHFFRYLLLMLGVVLALILAYSFIPQVYAVVNRFVGLADDENLYGRFVYWNAAIRSFNQHPIFGIGWYGFRNKIAPNLPFAAGRASCHNIYLQLLCETGIVGTFIFFLWFIYSTTHTVKLVLFISKNKNSINRNIKVISLFSVMYQFYFLLYGLTGNPLYDEYVYPIYFLTCIIVISLDKYKNMFKGKKVL